MIGYTLDLEAATLANTNFRKVIYTAPHSQLVVMALQPGEEIGLETHPEHDQFIRVEQGTVKAILNEEETVLTAGHAVVIPAGVEHNIVVVGSEVVKLYTLYTPPEHPDGTIQATKAEATAKTMR